MIRAIGVAVLAMAALDGGRADVQAQAVALTGGLVYPISSEPVPGGTVLFVDGRIAAVGVDVDIPAGAEVVDVTGSVVMPGIIDAMSYYGIAGEDMNEVPSPLTPELRIIEAFAPFGTFGSGEAGEIRVRELLSGGVTATYIGPGDATVVGGQGAVVKTAGARFDDLIVREPAAIDITLGGRPASTYREQSRSPSTRMAVVAQLRDLLVRAQEWMATSDAADAGPRNLGMEALARMLRGEIPARVQANATRDIRVAIELAEEFGFELVIDAGAGAHQMRDELADRGIPVVLGPISHPYISGEEIPDPGDYGGVDERNAVWLNEAGVHVSLASFSRGFGRFGPGVAGQWLLIDASIARGHGMSEADVLRAVTLSPAEVLGVADRLGSLEVGKDADVVVFDGDPLSILTWATRVYVGGQLVYEREN
ncbi:MAG: amidohydrolase family protein [Gemmatimonadetes bacterium]|nr:amidohydrolase family protein [Gemmatimonadota bacterium]MYC91884.1 amidohydrolase family protein [Gemmatimonadota bacterium]MYJ19121.1 amidohydrolase family protein [Gemmatimonadota bacterium]